MKADKNLIEWLLFKGFDWNLNDMELETSWH